MDARIPGAHLALLGIIHFSSVSHALKPRRAAARASICKEFQKNLLPALADGCIILLSRAGAQRTPASSNLKRPRKLPNRSREDRIRDTPFNWRRWKHDF